jgi:hypothetical protein
VAPASLFGNLGAASGVHLLSVRLRRFALVLLGILGAAMVAALPAAGKEGVKATLATSIPLDTLAGTPLKVAWTLAYIDDKGNRRLFGAAGVFVRLRSASGGKATTAFAPMDGGEYAATVVVPEGGIGDVQIGLRGWVSDANGTRTSTSSSRSRTTPCRGLDASLLPPPDNRSPHSYPPARRPGSSLSLPARRLSSPFLPSSSCGVGRWAAERSLNPIGESRLARSASGRSRVLPGSAGHRGGGAVAACQRALCGCSPRSHACQPLSIDAVRLAEALESSGRHPLWSGRHCE